MIGWIGLGDQGLPMATAIAEAGYPLHVWARRPASLDALGVVAHVRHDGIADLAAACDIVGLCVSTDEANLQIVTGGPEPAARRCEPLFGSFSRHVVYLGGPGSGQAAKLFNNALLMMNQASIADIAELAVSFGMDPSRLVEVLKLGSAASNALTYLNGLITLENVDHLAADETAEIQLFGTAMTENGVNADAATARGLAGATRLPDLMRRLNP